MLEIEDAFPDRDAINKAFCDLMDRSNEHRLVAESLITGPNEPNGGDDFRSDLEANLHGAYELRNAVRKIAPILDAALGFKDGGVARR